MSDNNNFSPLAWAWRTALLILGTVIALWLAVQLIEHIWIWLAVGAALAAVVTVAVLWLRRRRW